MDEPQDPNLETSVAGKGEKPWPVIVMLAMLISVIVAGLILAPRTEEAKLKWLSLLGTTNHGEFLNPPVPVDGRLLDSQGMDWTQTAEAPWKLILVVPSACEQSCQEMADLAARVHTRLNRDAPELTRGFLSLDGSPLAGGAAALNYEILQLADRSLIEAIRTSGISQLGAEPTLLLLDPIQVFFMAYDSEHDGIGMLEDLEHVIELAR